MGEQIEGEIEQLKQNMAQLQNGVKRYHTSGRAIEALKDETGGKEMLVPLTSSLYVPGILGDTDTILLDIGTGYFVEKSPEDGVDYCKRKVNIVRENMEKLLEFIQQKQNQAAQVNQVFNAKVMQMQEQQKIAEAQGV
jgi:prefoldin alpha subunit